MPLQLLHHAVRGLKEGLLLLLRLKLLRRAGRGLLEGLLLLSLLLLCLLRTPGNIGWSVCCCNCFCTC